MPRLVLVITWLVAVSAFASDAEWPHLYGPDGTGTSTASGVFEGLETVGVEERWRRPLGSGYAAMISTGGRVYTTFADADSDYATALDIDSGSEIWKTRIDDVFPGRGGSDPGTLASPAVGDGELYTISGAGRMVALNADSGELKWRVDLVQELGAKLPHYGFAASPLIDGPRLIVQVGGEEEHNLAAFERATGKLIWSSHHAERHTYASPLAIEVDGQRQIVALAGSHLIGVDGATGRLLWSLESDDPEPDRLLAVPGGRLFMPLYFQGGRMVEIVREGDSWAARELWRQPSVTRSHGTPVYLDGAVYTFQGSVLLCLDAATGEILWRQRVYDGSLIVVDGRLVLLSRRSGHLHLIEPSREGYRELLRLPVFEAGRTALTPPTFAADTLLLRNLEEAVALSFRDLNSVDSTIAGGRNGEAVLWRVPLEEGLSPSGRSGIAVTGSTLYTLAADATTEHLLAVSVGDGQLRWRRPLDELFSGAHSGAMGNVVVQGDRLYAVSTACRLHALALPDGEPVWQADLLESLGGGERSRGCETTPVVDDGLVIVHAAGVESRRVIALAATSGELVWSNDEIERPLYTSPIVSTVGGVRQVIVHTWATEEPHRSRLQGLSVADGALLWSHDIDEDWSWEPPVELSEDRFLVAGWSLATAIGVTRQGDGWAVERLWQKGQLETPVVLGDQVCGSRRGGVSCLSIETGEEQGRLEIGTSRLAIAGTKLAAMSYEGGSVHLLETGGAGLEQIADVMVVNGGAVTETPPTVVGDRLYVRNHEELVAVHLQAIGRARRSN